jgi:hypothetical protein
MSIISNKQVKLFNKILKEFSEEYSLITGVQLELKAKSKKISIFNSEVTTVLQNFIDCELDILNNITLFKRDDTPIDFSKINWEYLHTLYFISQGKLVDQLVVKECKKKREEKTLILVKQKQNTTGNGSGLPDIASLLGGDASESFGQLIGDIAGQVSKTLEGKDLSGINPQELMASMMSGNMNIAGVNLQDIIDKSTSNFRTKVESGEVDINDFTKQASSIMGKLNIDPTKFNNCDVD